MRYSMAEAARRIEALSGLTMSPTTAWRWITVGVRGVKLRGRRFGNRWTCTEDDIRQFLEELNQEAVAAE